MRLVAAALVALSVGIAVAAHVAGAAQPASREMTFIDQRSGFALVLQVELSARDAGAFTFRAPGVGLYEGRAGSAMRVLSPSSVVVDYEGPATLGPQVTSDTAAPLAPSRTVRIRLQAQINPKQRTAEATLTEGTSRHHLVARRVETGGLTRALAAFEDGVLRADWAVLYGLMNRDVRSAYTASSFASHLDAEVASIGRVVGLRRVSVGSVQTDDNGATYVVVTYSAETRSPTGEVGTTVYDVSFIPEQDEWKMWFSVPR